MHIPIKYWYVLGTPNLLCYVGLPYVGRAINCHRAFKYDRWHMIA